MGWFRDVDKLFFKFSFLLENIVLNTVAILNLMF